MNFLLVFVGGGLGSLLRYSLSVWMPMEEKGFPWATLWANVIACFIMGAGAVLFTQGRLDDSKRLILLTGLCGGFSTFSTFSAELLTRWTAGEQWTTIVYLVVSLLSGIAAILMGSKLVLIAT